ncbi:hypothetical protein WJX81_002457 [Elliptochloris bilobata]|uniref:Protein YIP n=1 Tax=Elliptochloris bilobata TaxID=381761 RepID=A0AAW1R2U5_9CHLO
MENQGWKALKTEGSPMRGSPAHNQGYNVQSTYFPEEPEGTGYVPPAHAAHTAAEPAEDPFAPVDIAFGAEPGTASGAAAATAHAFGAAPGGAFAAPAAASAATGLAAPAAAPGSSGGAVLQFQESNLPSYGIAGKMGRDVPRVPPYGGDAPLLGGSGAASAGLGTPEGGDVGGKFSMFNLKRYRKYFNVDTQDVLVRMRDSIIGAFKPDFLEKTSDSADLYGPFWIATTLVFLSAVAGNYASYVSYRRTHSRAPSGTDVPAWYYDIDKVGYSAILFYGYVGVIGLALFAALKWWFKADVGLAQVWCTYGYALSIFIPVSCVCVLPYEAVRWALIGAGTLTSGLFLLLNFRGPIFDVAGAKAFPVWAAMGILHLGLGLALKLYVFQYWKI